MMRYRGWFGESYRHSLAARGYRLGFVADPVFIDINRQRDIEQKKEKIMRPQEIKTISPDIEWSDYVAPIDIDMKRLRKIDDDLRRGRVIGPEDLKFYKKNLQFLYTNEPSDSQLVMQAPGFVLPGSDENIGLEAMYSKYPPEKYAQEMMMTPIGEPSLEFLKDQYLQDFPGSSIYPVYGPDVNRPFVPYWYGEPESMSPEESMNRFQAMLPSKEYQVYRRLISERPDLNSNLLSPEERIVILNRFKERAKEIAKSELMKDLGIESLEWPAAFKGPNLILGDREFIEAYPEMKKLSYKKWLESPKEGINVPGGLQFSRRRSDYYQSTYIDPFTGETKNYTPGWVDNRTMEWIPSRAEKMIDNKLKGFRAFLTSLDERDSSAGKNIPRNITNIGDAARWLKENKYPDKPLQELEEEMYDLGQEYLREMRSEQERKAKSRVVYRKPTINYVDQLRKVYSEGGAIFNSPGAAQVLVDDAKKAGIDFKVSRVKEGLYDKWAVTRV